VEELLDLKAGANHPRLHLQPDGQGVRVRTGMVVGQLLNPLQQLGRGHQRRRV
jgi:hypothetical protein